MESRFVLTSENSTEFEQAGVLRLPEYFPAGVMAAMADVLWADLETRFGIERNRRETWTAARPGHYQALIRSGVFDALGPAFTAIADAFLGAGNWVRPKHFGQPLVTFPTGGWEVPRTMWHFDVPPSDCVSSLPAIRIFTVLEHLRPRGGGTCYIAGSHRLSIDRAGDVHDSERVRSTDMKSLLRREEPWFAELFSRAGDTREQRFMIEGAVVRGVEIRVKEMTGEPGDIYLMHPAMMHTIAPNALDVPRLMLVQALSRR